MPTVLKSMISLCQTTEKQFNLAAIQTALKLSFHTDIEFTIMLIGTNLGMHHVLNDIIKFPIDVQFYETYYIELLGMYRFYFH